MSYNWGFSPNILCLLFEMKLFKHHSYVLHEDMLPSHLIILEEKKLFTFFSLSIQVYPRSFLWKCWSNKPVPATEKMCATWKAKKEPFPPSSPNLIWVIISESSNQLMWCAYYLSKTFCWLIKKVQELLERPIPYPTGASMLFSSYFGKYERSFRKEGPIRCRHRRLTQAKNEQKKAFTKTWE